MKIPYLSILQERSKDLRKQQTLAETIFWQEMRNRKCLGYKFYRQWVLLNYIVDFYCKELQLVIEIDGDVHLREEAQVYDSIRSAELESYGLTVLRYSNEQVLTNLFEVLEDLKNHITSLASSPLSGTRGG
jgi:very-short-patch-repair endonuclease